MSLVFAGVCSHAPGITGRAHMADPTARDTLYEAFAGMRAEMLAARPDVLVIVAAEHFANFFMNNMPAFAVGMADSYEGPIEDPEWLRIARVRVPGSADMSRRLIVEMMHTVDVAYAEEWKFDHGISVPLNLNFCVAGIAAGSCSAGNSSLSQALSGQGGLHHFIGIELQKVTNAPFQFIFYKGAAQVRTDLLAGHIRQFAPGT